jgi:transglutaminase-like putative cysteine protease
MSPQPANLETMRAETAVDYYFQLTLYLLVITGFATLASTGGLDIPTTLIGGALLLLRGYLLFQRQQLIISERWTSPLTLSYFAFFAIDYLLISRGFLPATVHLAVFALMIRMFSLRRERDYLTLAILAFLMVLAAAVLTVDSVFLICFALFLLTAAATAILMEMRRSSHSAKIQAKVAIQEDRQFAVSLTRTAPALMLMILMGTAAVFFLLPRMSAGYFGAYSFGTDFASGFSDRVQLGQIGRIQQSNAVVMHVQIDGDTNGHHDLYWRGVALSDFDGRTWSKPQDQFVLQRSPDNSFAIPTFGNEILNSAGAHQLLHYRVVMEPIGANVFFLAPWARSVTGPYRSVAADRSGAVFNFDLQHAITDYEAVSDIAVPSATELRGAGSDYPGFITATYLRLPPVDPRVPALAIEMAGSAGNDFDKAVRIANYLRTRYGYTLQLPSAVSEDPIADFLFKHKKGHCEYFASSMAILLRTLGIPSRVVNGFRSDEFNDLTGNYVVRAKDAHSWVEAYFPGYGWYPFDPTPAGAVATPQGWGRVALYLDAMASFWREWIVSYDSSHQYVLGQAALNGGRDLWEGARGWARSHYDSMLRWARRSQGQIELSPGRWTAIGLGALFLLFFICNIGRISRSLHRQWLRAHPERSPQQSAAIWYERMTCAVARRGVQRSAAQTPCEFLNKITDRRLRAPVARFTDVYESARFGNSLDDAHRLPELYEEVELAARSR